MNNLNEFGETRNGMESWSSPSRTASLAGGMALNAIPSPNFTDPRVWGNLGPPFNWGLGDPLFTHTHPPGGMVMSNGGKNGMGNAHHHPPPILPNWLCFLFYLFVGIVVVYCLTIVLFPLLFTVSLIWAGETIMSTSSGQVNNLE